jgi:hypothetical protein
MVLALHPPALPPAYSSAKGGKLMHTRTLATALACLALPILATAQDAQLKLPSFADLKDKAIKSIDITVDSSVLGLMSWTMDNDDKEMVELQKTLMGLKSVQIRSYRFTTDFAYSRADVDAVQSQLSGPGWSPMIKVHDRHENEDVDIYLALDKQIVKGLAIIAANRREFTILNIVGSVPLEQIEKLRQTFGVQGGGGM